MHRLPEIRVAIASTIFAIPLLLVAPLAYAQDKHLALAGIPSALTAPNGTGFAGIALTNKESATSDRADGSAVVGFAFGSAEETIGIQISANITSLENDFADSGFLSVKASRRIHDGKAPIYASIGFGYLGGWGDSKPRDETATIAFTRFSELQIGQDSFPVMATIGAGSHLRNNDKDPAIFFGLGIGVSKNVALSAAYTGQSVTLGTSFKFDEIPNMNFGLSVDDAFNDVGERRIVFTAGIVFDKLFGG